MAVAANHLLTGGDTSTLTTYTTASISPTTGRLVLLWVYTRNPSSVPTTVTGAGLTWVLVTNGSTGTQDTLSCFRAMGTASAGALTITFPGSINGACWSIVEYSGTDTSGTNGSGAIVQSVYANNAGAGAGVTVTLAAFSDVNNATAGGFSAQGAYTLTAGSGFTISGQTTVLTPNQTIASEFKATNDTTVDISGTSDAYNGIAVEIKVGSTNQTLLPTGITTGELTGNPTIARGAVTVSPTGIRSEEALGSTTAVKLPYAVTPTGIASAEAIGTPALARGAVVVSPTGIPSGEALGNTRITFSQVILPTGIGPAEAFGALSVLFGVTILHPTGIASGETFGSPTLATGGVVVFPTGITSAESFGTPFVQIAQVSAALTAFLERATKFILKIEEDADGDTTANKGLGR